MSGKRYSAGWRSRLRSEWTRRLGGVAMMLASCLATSVAQSQICPPVAPVACPNCFAVVVIPDTQVYTPLSQQPEAGDHLDLVTRYICRERSGWIEPTTGKQMPILMTLHLGDMVQNGDLTEGGAGPLAEWARIDAAYDNLDNCSPPVPYLVTVGNHDYASANYEFETIGYQTYFGADRWDNGGYACSDPTYCNFAAGEYFIGGGDTIPANSRNLVGSGVPGPPADAPGRHRVGVIRAPNGQRFLFTGLELAFDWEPGPGGFPGIQGDDSTFIKQVYADYPGVPTIVFHHSIFVSGPPASPSLVWGTEMWHGDSVPNLIRMEGMYNEVIKPYPQVLMLWGGHVLNPERQGDYTIARSGAPSIHGFLRNYQNVDGYGNGWNVIAVFDPDAGQIRVRSYRIDDEDAYATPAIDADHDGEPAPTECFDVDEDGVGERIIEVDFASLGGFTQLPSMSRTGLLVFAVILLGAGGWSIRVWRRVAAR